MTLPVDIARRKTAAGRNKRLKGVVAKLVKEYLEGRAAVACMDELVREARKP